MSIFGAILNYGKATMMRRFLGRFAGGGVGTALMAAYLGKKAYDYYQSSRRRPRVV